MQVNTDNHRCEPFVDHEHDDSSFFLYTEGLILNLI